MLDRIGLAAVHCRQFTIILHPQLSAKTADQILSGSLSRSKGGERFFALYGSTYSVSGVAHVAEGLVEKHDGVYHVELRYLQEKRSRPPRGISPVARLVDLLLSERQDVIFDCTALFTFSATAGWKLVADLPIVLPPPNSNSLFTHIEAFRLSKRDADEVHHWVQVRKANNGDPHLQVFFTAKAQLSHEAARELLQQISSLAVSFVRRQKEASRAT